MHAHMLHESVHAVKSELSVPKSFLANKLLTSIVLSFYRQTWGGNGGRMGGFWGRTTCCCAQKKFAYWDFVIAICLRSLSLFCPGPCSCLLSLFCHPSLPTPAPPSAPHTLLFWLLFLSLSLFLTLSLSLCCKLWRGQNDNGESLLTPPGASLSPFVLS